MGDVALGHDAVAGAPDTGAHEQLLDVLETAGRLVHEVLAGPVAEHPPRQSHFVVGHLDPGHARMFLIQAPNRQRNLRHAHRLASVGPVKNHIRHLLTPQSLGRLLAQHPTHRVRDIGLATAIGADDGRNARLEGQGGFIRKGLESQDS